MKGLVVDLDASTEENKDFRRVLYTGRTMQLVLMSLLPGEDIGEEVHEDVDQFFRVDEGIGEARLDGHSMRVTHGTGVFVPAGTRHNIINDGTTPLKLYTLYAPPEHADGTVHPTRAEAQAAHH